MILSSYEYLLNVVETWYGVCNVYDKRKKGEEKMKKIRGRRQKEEFRQLLERASKNCISLTQAFRLANAQYGHAQRSAESGNDERRMKSEG